MVSYIFEMLHISKYESIPRNKGPYMIMYILPLKGTDDLLQE